ncbi:unnamed protein product [Prorocentrum cordatum]|uniref:Chloride channel protein n=1 Tax=Prorocentrum cordatum TaxID=2364126 RepID=A0ABN9WHW7_9DINO|nr:unnamed protein product [Polarella glacialis]
MALAGGMPLGREGPFVHVAVCIGAQLLGFCQLLRSAGAREHLLQAAVAVGVAVTFTAPIAGLVFAMELMMPHLYDNGMKRISFLASAIGTLVFKTFYMWAGPGTLLPLVSSDMRASDSGSAATATVQEWLLVTACSGVLGLLQGLLGGFFVRFHEWMTVVVKALRGKPLVPDWPDKSSLGWDMLLLAVLALVGAVLQLVPECPLFGMAPGGAMSKHLFSVNSFADTDLVVLLCVFVVRWVQCSVCLSMPVPSGCIAPMLMLGGISGRIYGRVAAEVLCPRIGCSEGSLTFQSANHLAAYLAVIGASSFSSAVCGCLSIVIVMYELIDLPRDAIVPLALAHIIANWVARNVMDTSSIFGFDAPLKLAKLKALPVLNASKACLKSVSSRMRSMDQVRAFVVPRQCTSQDLQNLRGQLELARARDESPPSALPIVERLPSLPSGGECCALLGVIPASSLDRLAAAVARREAPGADVPSAASSLAADALVLAGRHGLLEEPLVVSPWISLRDAYIKAQMEYFPQGATFMVRDGGFLVGLLTQDDLLGV